VKSSLLAEGELDVSSLIDTCVEDLVAEHFSGLVLEEHGRASLLDDLVAGFGMGGGSDTEARLHGRDVVAHGVSVMGLQASSARAGLPPELTDQHATMEAIESLGRATLEELHRMLGVLRSGADHAPVQPLPRLDQLSNLCAGGGTPPVVRLTVEGHPRDLSTGLELSAYRIVQEALTNVRRHANAEGAWVRLTYLPDALDIEVVDLGDGSATPVRFGHGLVGIRERVALHGGSLVVGPTAQGFRVQVVLPTGGHT
jgi:signal transduction histidine kinase